MERALASVPGVIAARVNLAAETAEIERFAGSAGISELIAAVTATGYAARDAEDRAAMEAPRDRKAEEAADLSRRSWIAAALTLPVVVLAMGAHAIPGFHMAIEQTIGTRANWLIQFALTTAVPD